MVVSINAQWPVFQKTPGSCGHFYPCPATEASPVRLCYLSQTWCFFKVLKRKAVDVPPPLHLPPPLLTTLYL